MAKLFLTSVGALGGGTAFYYWQSTRPSDSLSDSAPLLHPPLPQPAPLSFSQIHTYSKGIPQPITMWDTNWDLREKKDDSATPAAGDLSRATRHLLLVRHGQYHLSGSTDEERTLTARGEKQARLTGEYLADLGVPISHVLHSTMVRASQTSSLILQNLPPDTPVLSSDLLREGAPFPPEPSLSSWKPSDESFFADSSRLEAAFRKFVHRPPVEQRKSSYELLVCHANVIRYFVCRALQLPPESWARLVLPHASVTQLSISPDGRVKLRSLGESGFMPKEFRTTS